MTLNLAQPYSDAYSPPRSTELVFAFPNNRTGVFTKPDEAIVEVSSPSTRFTSGTWSIRPNLDEQTVLSGSCDQLTDTTMTVTVPTDGLAPGFYDLQVSLIIDQDREITGATTFGWQVNQLSANQPSPDGFAEFWNGIADELRTLPLDLKFHKVQTLSGSEIDTYNRTRAGLPGNYDPAGAVFDEVEVYKVSFNSPNGGLVHGWFAKPTGEGPFPGLLVLPGAGNNPRPAPVEHARHGWAALDVQVHGFPVDHPVYPPLRYFKPTSRENHENFASYRNALMAVNALAALPRVDPDALAACGGSQGGRLTVMVAALDKRIRAGVAAITHYTAVPWVRWTKEPPTSRLPLDKADLTDVGFDAWYDVANFAPLVTAPMLLNAGLIDRVSPPTGIQKLHLRLAGEKEIIYLPNLAHDWSPAFDRFAWKWLNEKVADNDD